MQKNSKEKWKIYFIEIKLSLYINNKKNNFNKINYINFINYIK